ncbi:unnamed protein product, partial [Effrenium voratum]
MDPGKRHGQPTFRELRLWARQRAWQRAVGCLELLRSARLGGKEGTLAISACKAHWEKAVWVLSTLQSEGCANAISLAAAADACRNWRLSLALQPRSPDLVARNAGLAAAAGGGWRLALKALRAAAATSVDAVSYGAAVAAVGTASENGSLVWREALGLVEESHRRSLASGVGRNSAISACERSGCWEQALELIWGFEQQSLQCTIVTFNAAISACEKGKQWEPALVLLDAARARQLLPNAVTFNAVISACGRGRQWQLALYFLQLGTVGCDLVAHNAAMAACERSSCWQPALRVLAGLRERQLEADLITLSSCIGACAEARRWQQGLALVASSRSQALRLDHVAFVRLARAAKADAWPAALALAFGQVQEGLEPAWANAVCGPWQRAVSLLAFLEAKAVEPPAPARDAALWTCSTQGRRAQAWALLAPSSPLQRLWALAALSCAEPRRVHRACAAVFAEPPGAANGLACCWWSMAMLGAEALRPGVREDFARRTLARIDDFELDDLVTTAWGAAGSQDVLSAVQRRAFKIAASLPLEQLSLLRLGMQVLGVLFASKLAGCLSPTLHSHLQRAMPAAGRLLDRTFGLPKPPTGPAVAALEKPPDWEVYGNHTPHQLADVVSDLFGPAPIFQDASHHRGFLHRLDVPSSGLVLVSRSYEAFYELQVQLHAGQVARHYTALAHGRVPQSRFVRAPLLTTSSEVGTTCGRGRMAVTELRLLEHWAWASFSFSRLELRIATGRKHQIRSHLAFLGHPILGDGLYCSQRTWRYDQGLCRRHWLHRHFLRFSDSASPTVIREARSEVPQDLLRGLRAMREISPGKRVTDATGAVQAKKQKTEESKEPTAPPELEGNAKPSSSKPLKPDVGFETSDCTLNVIPSLGGRVLMPLTDGGMQYLIGGARANLGIKKGRYVYEVKVVESHNPSEGPQRSFRSPVSRNLVRVGFSLQGSPLLLGETDDGVYFDSDGFYVAEQKRENVSQRFTRDSTVAVVLNLDASSPNAHTVSLFRDGVRISQPQKLPEKLKGKTLFPHLSFKNMTVHVNFGPPLVPLPFTCSSVAEVPTADGEAAVAPPKDGKYEVIFPVAVPDEGTFDWLDDFLEKNPKYVELSDRAIIKWAEKSGITHQEANTWKHCLDKPDPQFRIPLLDDFSARRVIQAVAPTQPRHYVVMEVKSNLVKEERAQLLKRFTEGYFKTVAQVVMGEPPQDFKAKVHQALLQEKQEKATIDWKRRKMEKEQ